MYITLIYFNVILSVCAQPSRRRISRADASNAPRKSNEAKKITMTLMEFGLTYNKGAANRLVFRSFEC